MAPPDHATAGTSSWTTTRARIARYSRSHPGTPVPDDLRRDHAAARLEDHVRRIVDAAPPLTQQQRDRIAAALDSQSGRTA